MYNIGDRLICKKEFVQGQFTFANYGEIYYIHTIIDDNRFWLIKEVTQWAYCNTCKKLEEHFETIIEHRKRIIEEIR